ncbi:TrmB family transcriptional regulator [Halorhabdus rudnickae]|uniref:TrmB family transcriptional regulator n=1 Tax=Halorhabdus rudnickae TaxID=1775544 RepID=UPI00108289DF|nr:TrmB family transcriptional regulator sugar-binding domain-containing protein [Halorhabdus rudnickae]
MVQSSSSNETDIRDELSVFGFSETEIDTYLAILAQDATTTRTIAEEADVTQRAVYNIAERLENRGVVQVNEHASPTTIRAFPPAEAIENLSERLESIQPKLEETYNETTTESPEIQVVRSRETAIKHVREAIATAEHEVALTIPVNLFAEFKSELRAAKERDVFVLLLLVDSTDPVPEEFAGLADAVRYWDEQLPVLYTTDDTDAMIGDSTVVTGPHGKEHVVDVSEENLAGSIFSVFIGTYWPSSEVLYETDPDPLPRTFEWFRDATFQATLHEREGLTLHAEVDTDQGEHVSGTVTEVNQQFLEPRNGSFPLQNSIVIETDRGSVSLGGPGAFLEDYEIESITLSTER